MVRNKQITQIIIDKATRGLRIKFERLFARDMQRVLRKWFIDITKNLREEDILRKIARNANAAKRLLDKDEIKQYADEMLLDFFYGLEKYYLDSSQRKLAEKYYKMWFRRIFEFGAIETLKIMGFNARSKLVDSFIKQKVVSKAKEDEIVFELTAQELIADLENRAVRFGKGLTEQIITDARKIIRNNVYLGNVSIFDVSKLIAEEKKIPKWRGLKIARTETHVAFNTASFEMNRRSGVKRHYWLNVGDGRVREWHVINGFAGAVEVGQPFPSGQIQPGEGPAELVINCRCSLQPDLDDPSILLEPWDGGNVLYVHETGIRHFPKFLGLKRDIIINRIRNAIKKEKDKKFIDLLQLVLFKILEKSLD